MLEKNYKLKYTGQEVENLLDKASVSVDSTYVNNQMIAATEFKTGMILLWSGTTATIPSGWALCNGQNGTPNLTDRFVVGAGNAYSVGATGGSETVTLTSAQIPSHSHTYSKSSGNKDSVNEGSGWGSSTVVASVSASNAATSSTGSGGAHENRPPYYALAYIMKL